MDDVHRLSIRTRGVWEILIDAFELYRQDVRLYAVTGISSTLPFGVRSALLGSMPSPSPTLILVSTLATIGVTSFVWTALTFQMNERLTGREPAPRPSLQGALRALPRVAWALAIGLGYMGVTLLSGGVSLVLSVWVIPPVLLILPTIIAENRTGHASVKRAFALAKKGRWRILAGFGALIVLTIMLVAVYEVTGSTRAMRLGVPATIVGTLLFMMTAGLAAPWAAAVTLLLYYDRRVRLEAVDPEAEPDAPVS